MKKKMMMKFIYLIIYKIINNSSMIEMHQKSAQTKNQNTTIDFPQPQRLYPLPPLTFFQEASEPIQNLITHQHQLKPQPSEQFNISKSFSKLRENESEIEQLRKRLKQMEELYCQEKADHEYLKNAYKEGQILFDEMQSKNIKLQKEIQGFKVKKIKGNFGPKPEGKDVPVVRITVPNPKKITNNQSQNEGLYRQLRGVIEENNNLKKMLESEKQKSSFLLGELNRKLQKTSSERDSFRNQVNTLKEEIRQKSTQTDYKSKEGFVENYYNHISQLTDELEKLRTKYLKIEKSLTEKDNEILELKKEKELQYNQTTAKKLFSFSEGEDHKNQLQKIKSQLLYKDILISRFERERKQNQPLLQKCQTYERHLQLSVREMKMIQLQTKQVIKQLINKVEGLKVELEYANKKSENTKKQLEKVYEILQSKKDELDQCYKDIAQRSSKSSPSMNEYEDSKFKYILRERRDSLAN